MNVHNLFCMTVDFVNFYVYSKILLEGADLVQLSEFASQSPYTYCLLYCLLYSWLIVGPILEMNKNLQ